MKYIHSQPNQILLAQEKKLITLPDPFVCQDVCTEQFLIRKALQRGLSWITNDTPAT